MSRIWKKPIVIVDGVDIKIDWKNITVKWPKWQLSLQMADGVELVQNDKELTVNLVDTLKPNLWGLTRTLVSNMVEWVTAWFSKELMVFWVWYNVKLQWTKLVFNLWYSHPIDFELPTWISAKLEKDPKWNDLITISWIDKQQVGQVTAKIKTLRKLEPYKWKWIRDKWQVIKLKPWKTAKK